MLYSSPAWHNDPLLTLRGWGGGGETVAPKKKKHLSVRAAECAWQRTPRLPQPTHRELQAHSRALSGGKKRSG